MPDTPIDPRNIRALETIYTDAWRDEPGVRTERGRAGIAAVARAVVPPGFKVVPISEAPDDVTPDIGRESRERRQKRGW